MKTIRLAFAAVFAVGLALAAPRFLLAERPADLPARLSDQEFWKLSEELSEPSGYFQSDNLVSNERVFARAVPDLVARTKPGGVYLGVGPEQNFTYIAAMKPRVAFITDIRRGNLHTQLLYKALFELSADRADFVSRLFTKPRPAGLTASSTAEQLFAAYWDVFSSDQATFDANSKAIQDVLTVRHKLPLSAEDLAGIVAVYRAFYWYGPAMTWSAKTDLTTPVTSAVNNLAQAGGGSYRGMMTQADASGVEYSYLSSEERFNFVKDLESRNLIVPVVGDFAGPKALRGVGAWVRDHGAIVNAFYLSNVESYLRRNQVWTTFCGNVATFPIDETSLFIRPSGNGAPAAGRGSAVVAPLPTPTATPTATPSATLTPIPTPTFTPTITALQPPLPPARTAVQVFYFAGSGTNSSRSALDPIAPEVKTCTGTPGTSGTTGPRNQASPRQPSINFAGR